MFIRVSSISPHAGPLADEINVFDYPAGLHIASIAAGGDVAEFEFITPGMC